MTPEEKERWDRLDRILAQNAVQIAQTDAQIERTTAKLEQTNDRIQENSAKTDAQLKELGAYLLNLAQIVQRTDERLSVVINMIERRWFGNGPQPA